MKRFDDALLDGVASTIVDLEQAVECGDVPTMNAIRGAVE